MSREVLGDARLAAPVPTRADADPWSPSPPPPAPTLPARASGPPRHPRALLAALTVLAVGCGWFGYDRLVPEPGAEPAPVVAVTEAVGVATRSGTRARVQFTVVNPGRRPVRVRGAAAPVRDGPLLRLDPAPEPVPGGGSLELSADVRFACDGDVVLPGLVLDLPGGRRTVAAAGGRTALVDVCARGQGPGRPLVAQVALARADRLDLTLTAPIAPVRVLAVRAGGVTVGVGPAAPVDRAGQVVGLRGPARCPPEWERGGIPAEVVVDIAAPGTDGPAGLDGATSTGGTSRVALPIGLPLVDWLLRTSCSDVEGAG